MHLKLLQVVPKLDKTLADLSERLKGIWSADAVKAKFTVGSPKPTGDSSPVAASSAAAAKAAPQASDDWANFGAPAPAAASSAGDGWAAFAPAPAPAAAAPAPPPKPAPVANLLDDLFSAAPAPAAPTAQVAFCVPRLCLSAAPVLGCFFWFV